MHAAGYVGAQSEVPGSPTRPIPTSSTGSRSCLDDGLPGFVGKLRSAGRPKRVRWREQDGVRWLEAELPGARAAFSTRLGGVSELRSRASTSGGSPAIRAVRENRHRLAAASRSNPSGLDRPTGSRRRRGPTRGANGAAGLRGAGAGAAGGGRPRSSAGRAGAARLRRRLPAGGPRGTGAGGDDPLRLARAGGGDRGAGGGGAGRGRRRSGPGSARAATRWARRCWAPSRRSGPGWPRAGCSTCGRSPAACSGARGSRRSRSAELCTSCHPELFFSHRRDGEPTGRQAGLVWQRRKSRMRPRT